MHLSFDTIILRDARAEDTAGLVRITHDRDAMRYYGTVGAYFEDEAAVMPQIAWMQGLPARGGYRWIITEKGEGTYIGDIGFHAYDADHHRVEIGYRLCREHWGKGIITKAIATVVQWGFEERDYNRIEALVDVNNEGSKIVLLRNGFIKEGVLRDYEFEHGHYVDLEMYSLLKCDYLK